MCRVLTARRRTPDARRAYVRAYVRCVPWISLLAYMVNAHDIKVSRLCFYCAQESEEQQNWNISIVHMGLSSVTCFLVEMCAPEHIFLVISASIFRAYTWLTCRIMLATEGMLVLDWNRAKTFLSYCKIGILSAVVHFEISGKNGCL